MLVVRPIRRGSDHLSALADHPSICPLALSDVRPIGAPMRLPGVDLMTDYIDLPLWNDDDDNDSERRHHQPAGSGGGGTTLDDPAGDGDASPEPPEGDWGILAW